MSLYSALSAGVSGLNAESSAMAIVADNIANINTVGYKGTDAQFSTLVTDGSSGSDYSAGGVSALPVTMVSKAGLLQSTASSTDLAIQGSGFFVTRTSADDSGTVEYTRAGSFAPDKNGYLVNSAGLYLQGWRLDAEGNYTNTGSLDDLEPVRLSDLNGTASATTDITVRANLQSDADTYTGTYTAGDMATGTVTPTFSRSFTVSDAQGGSHQLTMSYLKTGANSWQTEMYVVPASDVTATNGLITSGTMAFNGDGSLDKADSTPALFDPLNITYTNGAASSPINLNLGTDGGIDGMTQFGGGQPSALISSTVNGGSLGSVASIQVSDSGIVSAVFDDGSTRAVFQLPLATFQNPNGLTRVTGNAYAASNSSGAMNLNSPGSLGAGEIASNNLEASTVDLASEFTNMIRFQRAYSASSKVITTVDDMLQELSNMKR